jgi:tetratricopeptide (TPR) repeat protein
MKIFLFLFLFLCSPRPSDAQGIMMKDGKHVLAKSLKRQGDNIMATDPAENGGIAMKGEVGYPLAQVEKLEFPEPAQIKSTPDLIVAGKATEAVAQLDAALRYYDSFRDAPGSYWGELTLLKCNALLSLGRVADVEALAQQLTRGTADPELALGARAMSAAVLTNKGEYPRAIEIFEGVLKDAIRGDTPAIASIYKGRSHLALKQWEPALLSFLMVPVFYPEARALMPPSLLGAGRAYFQLDDFEHAKTTLNDLIKAYANTPEAAEAKTELEKIIRKEKALEGPGAPVKAPANPNPPAKSS